ncbi:hypothetical protein T01_15410 [Trichinella spiralis]|uniref:Uncharacterized protein n=1 Tax=Trichinella spiralis TaxID=6334 RepID=A0A0V0Z4J0_TRISP|nr:hypothetical protein T01_15410 [Trichinella spiralis]
MVCETALLNCPHWVNLIMLLNSSFKAFEIILFQ